jgi:dTDP-4-amino-4,6-dideoxygalactose transaminase
MEKLVEAASSTLRGGWYILGKEVEQFERSFARLVGVDHAIGVGNGLDALKLVLSAWDIAPGKEVIVPTNTFIATWLAVTATGATPVPVDPDDATWNLSAGGVLQRLGPATAAVIPVHLHGKAVDVQKIQSALPSGVKVLEDAAQAQGAEIEGRVVGSLADAAAFSFYPTKNLGALGDAGMVTTNDSLLAERVSLLRNYGSQRKYYNEIVGWNSRLDELQAAFLNVKLQFLRNWNDQKASIADEYLERLAGAPGITLPPSGSTRAEHVWYSFNICHDRRDKLQEYLAEDGIGTLIFYPEPPHLSLAYRSLGYARGDFPVAEKFASTSLALPIAPYLTEEERSTVVDAVWHAARRLS